MNTSEDLISIDSASLSKQRAITLLHGLLTPPSSPTPSPRNVRPSSPDIDELLKEDEESWWRAIKIDFVQRLSPEVVLSIFRFVPAEDLSVCGGVSTNWRRYARDPGVWKELCRRTWAGKQFHPLELHPLVDWTSQIECLTKEEILGILKRRGVLIRPGNPASASWPSSAFPSVSLWSWSWGNQGASPQDSVTDMAWLRRLITATLPLHVPQNVPQGGGKWMASYACSIMDSRRTTITRMELSGIRWRLGCNGEAQFLPDGTWISDTHEHREWWRIRKDGRPQVNFFPPLTVSRREDWGFELKSEVAHYVSLEGKPPLSLGANLVTDL
ncbi:hypothetical protein HDU67_008466 [Dinochytrium kinnereticum]|nr:hypothetical protein HDU67_008466 [Dinochytrium kinnereticum]